MEYFSKEMQVSPEKIKLLDICGKQKNVIPTVEGHKRVLVFADEAHEDLFYDFWEAGFGDYDMWYAVGIEEEGQVKHVKIKEVINRKLSLFVFATLICSTSIFEIPYLSKSGLMPDKIFNSKV